MDFIINSKKEFEDVMFVGLRGLEKFFFVKEDVSEFLLGYW